MLTTAPATSDDLLAIGDLLARVRRSGGGWELSEHKSAVLLASSDRVAAVVRRHGRIVGYGQAAWHAGASRLFTDGHWGVELVVEQLGSSPDAAVRLLDALRSDLPTDAALGVWADDPLRRVLREAGLRTARTLLRLSAPVPLARRVRLPDAVTVTPFVVDRDEEVWLQANNTAFAGHPENGALTRRDLEARLAEAWFDSDGFLLGWEAEELVAFCWTKRHGTQRGEIYIIGVAPHRRGRGLGGAMLTAGAGHLRDAGADTVFLYVEADNDAARRLYSRYGFTLETKTYQMVAGDEETQPNF